MTLVGIIGTVLAFIVWLVKRQAAQADDPVEQHRKAYAEIEKPVGGAGDDRLANRLDELERLQNSPRQQ